MLSEIFQKPKPILGPVHVLPLPGSSAWRGDWSALTARAEQEAAALAAGGVDGLIVTNQHDDKGGQQTDPAAAIAMASLVRHLHQLTGLPVGLSLVQNDPISALAIAINANAAFIRLPIPVGARVTEAGVINNRLQEMLRYQSVLKCKLPLILADVTLQHIVPGTESMRFSQLVTSSNQASTGSAEGGCPVSQVNPALRHLLHVTRALGNDIPIIPVVSDTDLSLTDLQTYKKLLGNIPVLLDCRAESSHSQTPSSPFGASALASTYYDYADGILLEASIRKKMALKPDQSPTIDMSRVEELINRMRGVPNVLEMDADVFLQPELYTESAARCPVDHG